MKLAFLFPGQGSQIPNMLDQLPQHKVIEDTIQEAMTVLNENVYELHQKDALQSTKAVQLSLLINEVAAFRLFKEEGIKPDVVAGHSVGAFAAAVAAGVISFPDALEIVKLRGELMEKTHPTGYGMGVVLGLDTKSLREIVHEIHQDSDPVYMSNINAPHQITVSGSVRGLKKVMEASLQSGAQCASMLNVSTPSHSPLLESVSTALKRALEKVTIYPPEFPFAGNRRARLLDDPSEIMEDLASSVSAPVKWHDATTVIYEKGARYFVEMPPGNVLTKLVKKTFPEVRAFSVTESGFEDCLYIMNRDL